MGALLGFLKSNILTAMIKKFFKALTLGLMERLITKEFALEAFLSLLAALAEKTQSKQDDRLVARMRQIVEGAERKDALPETKAR